MFKPNRNNLLIPDIMDGYGVAFRDINGDSLPDIYLVCFRGLNRLLINRGKNNEFRDATIRTGLAGFIRPHQKTIQNLELGTTIVDFDNDADGDVVIAGWGVTTSLYQNNRNYTFRNISKKLDIRSPLDANGCFAADVNNDGFLDLFFTDEKYSNRLLLNTGNESFIDCTEQSGLAFSGRSQGASFCDVDLDGDPDLYVTNWNEPDLFYRNIGNGYFKRMLLPIEVCQDSMSTNGVTFADIDNDGDFDFLVTNREGMNYLYFNETLPADSNWIFQNVSTKVGLTDEAISYGSVIADFNNDSWQDIFITNIGVNQFYVNRGYGVFQKIYEDKQAIRTKQYSTGAACADYNCDGDVDLFVANKDTFCLFYENPTNNSAFIKIKIQGIISNRDAIGTRIELYNSPHLNEKPFLIGMRQISGGGGYLSLNEPIVHFGLDTVKIVDLKIVFPSGKIITRKKIAASQTIQIDEYKKYVRITVFSYRHLKKLLRSTIFWYDFILTILFIIQIYVLLYIGLKRYRWKPKTATFVLAAFFLMAYIVMVSLKKLGLYSILVAINLLTITLATIALIYAERFHRLRKIRNRYRSVLHRLSDQMITIHDNQKLLEIVIDNFFQNTEFDICCAFIIDLHHDYSVCHGVQLECEQLKLHKNYEIFTSDLKKKNYLLKEKQKNSKEIFEICGAEIAFVIQREKFYGFFTLGATEPFPPFTAEDISLFQTIASQMAVTLENNDYIRQSQEMIKKITAAEVQQKYLEELEITNQKLDRKNQELQKLYNELKNTQSQLIQSEKMASLGQLVAGISHELNNPIGFIYSNIKLLDSYIIRIQNFLKEFEKSGENYSIHKSNEKETSIEQMFQDIEKLIADTIRGSQMVKRLVENLRQFSYLDQEGTKLSDIHEGIETCLMILKPQLNNRIEIEKAFNSLGFAECNIGQINQVILNILMNATQSIHEKGHIKIFTYDANNTLNIEIEDDGAGIPQNILNKIFDPFFTTKDVGEGTGLGLSISYSIVKNHGGTIEVRSEVNKGSKFIIKLPQKRIFKN